MNDHVVVQKASTYAWFVWGIGALFFYFAYILRVSPETISTLVVGDLPLPESFNNTHEFQEFILSMFTTAFLVPYVLMQLPVGLLIDRFGARNIVTLGLVLVGISQFVFVTSGSLYWMIASRALLGFAASFAFISAIRLATMWFPPHQLGFLAGLTQAMGMVGASIQRPLFEDVLIGRMGLTWAGILEGFTLFFMVMSLIAWLLIRDVKSSSSEQSNQSKASVWHSMMTTFKQPQTWMVGIYAGMLYVPLILLGEVFGKTFFTATQSWGDLADFGAKTAIACIFWGFTAGGFVVGAWSDKLKKRRPFLVYGALVSLVLVSIVVYLDLPVMLELGMTTIMGMSLGSLCVAYAMSGEINPDHATGISIGLVNGISVFFGTLLVPAVTALLNHMRGAAEAVSPVLMNPIDYDGSGLSVTSSVLSHEQLSSLYRQAFSIIPVAMVVAIILASFFIKETHCVRYEQRHSK